MFHQEIARAVINGEAREVVIMAYDSEPTRGVLHGVLVRKPHGERVRPGQVFIEKTEDGTWIPVEGMGDILVSWDNPDDMTREEAIKWLAEYPTRRKAIKDRYLAMAEERRANDLAYFHDITTKEIVEHIKKEV
jgi:hypothetical protein